MYIKEITKIIMDITKIIINFFLLEELVLLFWGKVISKVFVFNLFSKFNI